MALEELTMFAAGYWLAESRTKVDPRSMNWESIAGFLRDAFDLAWQLLLLVGLGWVVQALSARLPQANLAGLGLTLVSAYGLSLLRRRPEGAEVPYFLALTALTFGAQHVAVISGVLDALKMVMRVLGGTLACEVVLLGLKERLRWSKEPKTVQGIPMVFLCLAMLAVILWSLGF